VLTPEAGDELRYEIQQQLTLPPGHHQVRLNATSKVVEKSGSVYAEVEVPDFTRSPLSTTGIILGTPPIDGVPRTDVLSSLVPVVPVSARCCVADMSLQAARARATTATQLNRLIVL